MPDIPAIQAALQQFGIDGWLLYDFRGSNPLARRVLQIPDGAMLMRAAGSTSSRPAASRKNYCTASNRQRSTTFRGRPIRT